MGKKVFNVGIIGCGGISAAHIGAMLTMDNIKITAVCDIRPERAEAAAAKTGAKVYTDYKELLASGVEAVHLCTPHYLHAPMAIEAMEMGIHVVTEKPMAISLEDARKMIAVSEKPGNGKLCVIFQRRYCKTARQFKAMIDSGKLGEFLGVRANVNWKRDKSYYVDSGWRGSKATEGGGSLINQAVHTLDMLSYLFGPIAKVRCEVFTGLLDGIIEVEDNSAAVCVYESGKTALVHTSNNFFTSMPPTIEAHYENMIIRFTGDTLFKVDETGEHVITEGEDLLEDAVFGGIGHKPQLAHYYDCLEKGEHFWLDGRAGFPALSLVLAMLRSSEEHRWVDVEKAEA